MATKVIAKGGDGKALISFRVAGNPSSTAIFRELRRWHITPITHQITIHYNVR